MKSKRMSKKLKVAIAVIASMMSLSALAENYGFLANSAMSYFTPEDWQIFNKTQAIALNRGKNGQKIVWSNPKSGSHGYMIPSAAPGLNGMQCRNIVFYNTANRIDGEGSYKFCKVNNQWKIY
jgi:surface antigen